MDEFLKDARRHIKIKVNSIGVIMIIILLGVIILWGESIISYIKGPSDFSSYEHQIIQRNATEIPSLNTAYINLDVEHITGSYAEYGEAVEDRIVAKQVYYVMPINEGTYFITILAQHKDLEKLNEMEEAFYNSIGKDDKIHPESFQLKGGFQLLNEDEKDFAMDFFTGYDENVTNKEELSKILSPYAFVVGNIGNISTTKLQGIIGFVIVLLILLCILYYLYYKDVFLGTLKKDILQLSDENRNTLDDDFQEAKVTPYGRFGNRMMYMKRKRYHIWSYDELIWMYKKEALTQADREYRVFAYDKEGQEYIILKTDKEEVADKMLNEMFDHCKHALLGYQSFLFDTWRENPNQLYQTLIHLQLIFEEKENKRKEEEEKKEKAEKRKRRVAREKKETRKRTKKKTTSDDKKETVKKKRKSSKREEKEQKRKSTKKTSTKGEKSKTTK